MFILDEILPLRLRSGLKARFAQNDNYETDSSAALGMAN